VIEIPVHYGGRHGPDLAEVAGLAGPAPEQVIALHSGREYSVDFLGFAPGFAYLGPLAPELTLPRRPVPRPWLPAGSVAVGGPQTAVYPVDGPGGWWLIGWTPFPVWDPARVPPALLEPGRRVRFRPLPTD
jgi:KipI family sensor histidine kinase inhibitor